MARRVIQFPVRNAFHAQRSADALARQPETYTQRIDEMVQREVERLAMRQASGQRVSLAAARGGALMMMPQRPSRPWGGRMLAAMIRAARKVSRRS